MRSEGGPWDGSARRGSTLTGDDGEAAEVGPLGGGLPDSSVTTLPALGRARLPLGLGRDVDIRGDQM